MKTIAFIGLGHMGLPMVKNLIVAGHAVQAYDVLSAAIEQAEEVGATGAESVAEVVKDADVVFTMVQTGEQVIDICLSNKGIFANMPKRALYIDSSSIDVNDTRELHKLAKEHHLTMVEAPVSGGVKAAELAALTVMVGGETNAFNLAEPILQCLGHRVIHAGGPGTGQAAKICNNMILGVSMIAVSEAFVLAQRLGLDPKIFFDISSHASGNCWAMSSYCPVPGVMENVPSNNDYQPGFAAQMMLKDLKLSQVAASSVSAKTELGALATKIYQHYVDAGGQLKDFSGVIQMLAHGEEL